MDMDVPSTTVSMLAEETPDKESISLTASSSLTLRTTSDDEITNSEQVSLSTLSALTDTQSKVFSFCLFCFSIFTHQIIF